MSSMEFKEGMGWKACFDEERGLYTAELWGMGNDDLYEIDEAVYGMLGKDGVSDSDAASLISTGRHLYMHVNDRMGPPYTVVLDSDYRSLCPWASVSGGGELWSEELTDAAVELFASEEKNREQRAKKRAERGRERRS